MSRRRTAEQQQRVGEVEQEVRQVMAGGLEAVKLAIQHVGNPSERMPVAGVAAGERPVERVRRDASLHGRILHDVLQVVVVNKIVADHRAEHDQRPQRQGQADEHVPAVVSFVHRVCHQ